MEVQRPHQGQARRRNLNAYTKNVRGAGPGLIKLSAVGDLGSSMHPSKQQKLCPSPMISRNLFLNARLDQVLTFFFSLLWLNTERPLCVSSARVSKCSEVHVLFLPTANPKRELDQMREKREKGLSQAMGTQRSAAVQFPNTAKLLEMEQNHQDFSQEPPRDTTEMHFS